MVICCQEILFFGHIIGKDSVKSDVLKVAAIDKMEEPKNVAEPQTFMGVVSYLSRFTPRLATLTAMQCCETC